MKIGGQGQVRKWIVLVRGNPSLETATVACVVSDEAQLQVARQKANTKRLITKREAGSKVMYKCAGAGRKGFGLSTELIFCVFLHKSLFTVAVSSQQGTEFDFSVRFGGMAKSGG